MVHQSLAPLDLITADDLGAVEAFHPRILGGEDCTVIRYPFVVFIRFVTSVDQRVIERTENAVECVGSLLTLSWILTAASCIRSECFGRERDQAFVHVTAGTDYPVVNIRKKQFRFKGLQERYADKYHTASRDSSNSIKDDIAVIHLETPFDQKPNVQPIQIPGVNVTDSCKSVVAMAWDVNHNKTKRDKAYYGPDASRRRLQCITLELTPIGKCKETVDPEVGPQNLCAFGTDKSACVGDAGGPIVCNDPNVAKWVQLGLIRIKGTDQCDEETVAMRLDYFLEWLEKEGVHLPKRYKAGRLWGPPRMSCGCHGSPYWVWTLLSLGVVIVGVCVG